ncbi:MAG: pterin-binding protein [Chloroflexi bacterium RBG_16_50_9]|nr:MAG: pterin-binding protein [Chloroflexi bacterium RBG_16_50_9]
METRILSPTKEVIIGNWHPTVLIGERINPAGKKNLAQALKAGNMEIVRGEALAQAQAGADILDISVGAFGVDEVAMLPQAVQAVLDTIDIPLCLDSTNPEALAAALKVYKGKPLINSVTGEERSLVQVLPLVRNHRAAVIGLVQDDEGIPKSADRRVAIARKVVQRAEAVGIAREDIIIDCLASAVGADTSSGLVTLETIRRVKAELGVNITLGASNISFGLPDRDVINNTLIPIAIEAGVTCLMVDVARVRPAVLAADLILNRDKRARRYIEMYRQRSKR